MKPGQKAYEASRNFTGGDYDWSDLGSDARARWAAVEAACAPQSEVDRIRKERDEATELVAKMADEAMRIGRNRDMWQGQSKRQAETLTELRDALVAIRRRAIFGPGITIGDLLDMTALVAPSSDEPEVDRDRDATNPFAPRPRPQKSIRLMTDAERRAAGLDPNGGFDGPTGAD